MSDTRNFNKVKDQPQHSYNHLKLDDYWTIINQSKRDYEKSLNQRMQQEIKTLGLIRNGYRKPRVFHTPFGTLRLRIPRVLYGNYSPSFIIKNSPFDYHLLYAIQSMYLGGMSQRAITDHLNVVYNLDGVTRRQVQTAIDKIIKPGLDFLERDLSQTYYPALFIDAHYTPIREGNKVSKKAIMIVIGMKSDGSREILGMDIQTSEAASNYRLFFQKLLKRGLQSPEVIVSDEHKGLRLAIRENFSLSCWRRCNFHLLKTVGKLSGFDSNFTKALSEALLQKSHLSLIHDTFTVLEHYRNQYPQAVELVESSLSDLMNFYPNDALAKLTATNNISESLNSLIRSRTDSVRVFPHSQAYIKMVANILIDRSNKWRRQLKLEDKLSREIYERRNRRLQEVRKSLKETAFVLNTNITSPCILWIDVFYENVSLSFINVSLGVILVYACDAVHGKREPIAFEYILDNLGESVRELIQILKTSFDLQDLFLIVAPLALEPYRNEFLTGFPGVDWQLDVSSFTESVCNIAPKKQREEITRFFKNLYRSKTLERFQMKCNEFSQKYSEKFPRVIAEFNKYINQTTTYLKLGLPRSRVTKVDQISKSLLDLLKAEISEKTTSFRPYLKIDLFDKLLKRLFRKVANTTKSRAYINPDKLQKFIN